MTITSQFLVLTGQLIFQFTGLVEFGIYTLQFLLLVTEIALTLLVHGEGFVQASLQFYVDLFKMFNTLLKFASSSIGLRKRNYKNMRNFSLFKNMKYLFFRNDMKLTFSKSMIKTSTSDCKRDFCFSRLLIFTSKVSICSSCSWMRAEYLRRSSSTYVKLC